MNQLSCPQGADVTQIGRNTRAFTVDGMAAYAVACTAKKSFPAGSVTRHQAASVKTSHVTKIGDDAGKLRGSKRERLHRCAGYAVGDGKTQIIVGNNSLELAGAKVYARDHIAVFTVARGAL
jgi:hypothetical protein